MTATAAVQRAQPSNFQLFAFNLLEVPQGGPRGEGTAMGRPTFPIARFSSSHDFAHSHDDLRR
ncbi:protein of unknown function [Bradyrhizobium vignae]|uniref:Uncharacterized protein n=1 Tax=Bradyrhizobium vignae TaxID=1549949 RepID=A0A2U3QBC6_9BRAD|nr:protein of unknown function [Bradyrhizobium vignae]